MNHKSHIGFCSNFPFNRPAMSERSESNGGGGIPGFALEPKFAPQISIGALPLWRSLRSLSPRRRGKILFPHPFRVRIPSPGKQQTKIGGGGIRTPVPRCFEASFYMHSRFIIFFASLSAKRQAQKLAISVFLAGVGPNNRLGQSAI